MASKRPIQVRVDSPHGVRRITGVIEQNGNAYPVFERIQPASRFAVLAAPCGSGGRDVPGGQEDHAGAA